MPFSVADVQRAYSTDLSPVLNVVDNIQQQQMYQQRLAEQRRRQEEAARLQGIGLIQDTVNPLEKGTGFSPLDELHAQQLGEIKARATQMVQQGGDPTNTYLYLQQATNGLKQRQLDATRAISRNEAWAKEVADKDPGLDYYKVYQQGLNNIFYSKDQKGNAVFNPSFDPSTDFTRGVDLDAAIDPVKAQSLAAAELGKLYTERQIPDIPTDINGITLTGKAPAYITIDPKARRTAYDLQELKLKGTDGKELPVAVFKDDVVDSLFSSPNTSRYLRAQVKEYRRQLPNSISDEEVKKLVATDFIQTHGVKPGAGVSENDEGYNRLRQSQHDAEASYYRKANLSLSYQAAQRAAEALQLRKDNKTKKAIEDAINPYTVTTEFLNNNLNKNQLASAVAAPHMVNRFLPPAAGMGSASYPMLDYQTVSGKPFLKDPNTGQMVKVYAFTSPDGEKTIAVDYFTQKKGELPTPDKERPTKLIKGRLVAQYHTALANQLQLKTKAEKENFEEVVEENYDFNAR